MRSGSNLEKYTADFSVSRPVFRLHIGHGNDRISPDTENPVYKFTPTPIEGDILSSLVCENYREQFSIRDSEFTFDKYQIIASTHRDIKSYTVKFIEKNLPLRNPKQSKLYRWAYRSMPDTFDFNNDMLLMYKYMESFSDESTPDRTVHINNVLLMLEAMMEKNSEQ